VPYRSSSGNMFFPANNVTFHICFSLSSTWKVKCVSYWATITSEICALCLFTTFDATAFVRIVFVLKFLLSLAFTDSVIISKASLEFKDC
jgi:hypothetical protein